MDERVPEFRSTKNASIAPDTPLHQDAPLHHHNILSQERHQSSSSSPPSSSDLHSGSSKTSQARGTLLSSGIAGQRSSKGKATGRHTTSKSSAMSYQSSASQENSMVQVPMLVDPAGEVTYTPTTHRISKAKKGKKVHVCEYGCGKV